MPVNDSESIRRPFIYSKGMMMSCGRVKVQLYAHVGQLLGATTNGIEESDAHVFHLLSAQSQQNAVFTVIH